ncbi:MAG: tetratricopeptide repeat protein, partial [Candidatus Brocadiae bacterium]|nr:tetratricopeptide repeat protein [Candidatus Brocadiia bacterium]
MATPMEHVEALALSMVARGAGTHPVEGHPGVEEAVVAFVAGDLGTVEVTLRAAGAPVRTFRFGIAAPVPAAPAAAAPPAALPTEQDVVRLRAVTEESPEDLCAWRELGRVLILLKRPAEAAAAMEKAVALNPSNPFFSLELGLFYSDAGRHADAAACFEKIVAIDPTLDHWVSHPGVAALMKLAQSRRRQGDAAAAATTLRAALPLVAAILCDLGAYSMDSGNHLEAAGFLGMAGTLAPRMVPALHGAGRSLLWIGRPGEALPWLTQAVTHDSSCVEAWYDLGIAYARLGRRVEARRTLRRVLHRDPAHDGAWYDLGCLDALEGKRDAAFRHL